MIFFEFVCREGVELVATNVVGREVRCTACMMGT